MAFLNLGRGLRPTIRERRVTFWDRRGMLGLVQHLCVIIIDRRVG